MAEGSRGAGPGKGVAIPSGTALWLNGGRGRRSQGGRARGSRKEGESPMREATKSISAPRGVAESVLQGLISCWEPLGQGLRDALPVHWSRKARPPDSAAGTIPPANNPTTASVPDLLPWPSPGLQSAPGSPSPPK